MQWRIAFCLLIASVMVTPVAAEEDPRAPLKLPPDDNGQNSSFVLLRAAFMEEMRHHMDSLDDVMAQLATAGFKGAGKVARAIDARVGRRVRTLSPVKFREMDLGMHRATADFAEVVRARHYQRLDPGLPFGEVGDDDRCDRRWHQRSRNRFLHRAAAER